jgi:hypothetical protein
MRGLITKSPMILEKPMQLTAMRAKKLADGLMKNTLSSLKLFSSLEKIGTKSTDMLARGQALRQDLMLKNISTSSRKKVTKISMKRSKCRFKKMINLSVAKVAKGAYKI